MRRQKSPRKAKKTSRPPNTPKIRRPRSSVIAVDETSAERLAREHRETLEQQAATNEVLRIIRRSPADAQPVFDAIVESASRLCGAIFSAVYLCKDDRFRIVATNNFSREATRQILEHGQWRKPDRSHIAGRAMLDRAIRHVPDVLADPEYSREWALAGGWRAVVAVPLLRDNKPLGVLSVSKAEPVPFSDWQIQLLNTFADQALIAIENVRLFEAERERTQELSEALDRQTATSEVLQVISSSPDELEPVFQAMLENATRICEANCGTLVLYEGDAFRIVAMHGAPIAFSNERQRQPVIRPGRGHHLLRLLETKKLVHIADISVDPALAPALAKFASARTLLTIPMLKENELVGAIGIYRQEVRLFTDRQIELVTNFAAQAVIAIENARLLNDLNKLNQQLEQRVTDQVSEIERMSRLRRFLPAQVADLIVASGAEKQLESHRREITALFCDLRGFTGFSESSDPEDVMALLREYHAAIGGIINKYGGTLERYAGDGVMVVFNDPIPVDNPALQAVLMAIEMRVAIGGLIEKWRKLGHDIGFGIGIAHGFATLGTIGFEGRFDYAAIGTVSNVASRLCDEAKPGQILISPRVLMAVEKDITVEPVGDFALKGIRRPLTAYNVLATKAAN